MSNPYVTNGQEAMSGLSRRIRRTTGEVRQERIDNNRMSLYEAQEKKRAKKIDRKSVV
jgi:hypothetical protein